MVTACLISVCTMTVHAEQSSTSAGASGASNRSYGQDAGQAVLPEADPDFWTVHNRKPVYTRVDPVDDTYRIEVEDYKRALGEPLNGNRSMEYDRYVRLVSSTDQKVVIEWLFRAAFVYDGVSSRCTDTDVVVRNFALQDFVVTEHELEAVGNSAIGNCGAVLKKKGKKYGEKIRIDVNLFGEVELPDLQ